MAIDKLGLYNNSLLLLGQRELSTLTEDRPPRYALDAAYDLDAVKYCLEIVKPSFASKVATLSSPATSPDHDLDSVHTLPTDFIDIIGVYSDSKLDQEINRYIHSSGTIACEHTAVYLRYVSDDHVTSFTNWSVSFANVVASYLARQICIKIAPEKFEAISNLFVDRVEAARGLELDREPATRSSATTVTLTNTWRHIYNDALLIMGLDEITANTDDSNRRTKLDRALDAGLVADLLEDIGWTFAITSTRSQYNPSIEPAWGYRRAHDKPSGMHRLDGVFQDEYMQVPLKHYADEGGMFLCELDEIYIKYVSDAFLTTPDNWPPFFKRLVAGKMAVDAAGSLRKEGADEARAERLYAKRKSDAESNDAMSAPPRILARGSWSKAFTRGSSYRGRPGDS